VTMMRFVGQLMLVLALAAGVPGAVGAQTSVTTADVQRLQDNVYDASREIAQIRGRDSTLMSQLQAELDDARDEVIYLKVKLRKNEPVAQSEYTDLRGKIEYIRSRAHNDVTGRAAPSGGSTSRRSGPVGSSGRISDPASSPQIPAGTEFDIRLTTPLNSGTAQVEDRIEATTIVDLRQDNRVLVPAGSVMRGVVNSVQKAGRLERKGSVTVEFNQIRVNGRTYPIHATVTQALESEGIRGEAGRIGAGAGVGAIIGGILGGLKGALAGILIGGGGTIAATEGKDVDLPSGTVLRVRLDSGLDL
jgi:TolA-binding protein